MKVLVLLLALLASRVHGEETEWRPPFITTPPEVVERMLQVAETRADDLVIDLGSGDGRIVIAAARKFGARAVGIELDGALVQKSRDAARAAQVADKVSFIEGDVLAADISRASVITAYLLPDLMRKLQSRFMQELAPGTRIVSHAFTMAGWAPDRSEVVKLKEKHPGQGDESRLHLWIVPADVRGVWRGPGMEV
ncbi:MAG TPA: methyltransferase domain-containing protein, partial [Burkholderiales bacterium]